MKKFQKYLITLLMCSFAVTSFIGMSSCSKKKNPKPDDSTSESVICTEHDWKQKDLKPAPTCEAGGSRLWYCNICWATKSETLPKTGHNWEWGTLTWNEKGTDGALIEHSYTGNYCVNDNCGLLASQNLEYRYNSKTQAYEFIGIGNCMDEKLYIPSRYDDGTNGEHPVKLIGSEVTQYRPIKRLEVIGDLDEISVNAFARCENLEEVVFNGAVKTIAENAFVSCEKLANIEFDGGVESVGVSSFKGCVALKEIDLPFKNLGDTPTLGNEAFSQCSALEKVVIGDIQDGSQEATTELQISNYAFADCKVLKEVTLGKGIKNIGEYAFSNCEKLSNIAIPDSVTTIGNYAFSNCGSFTEIVIPDSVTKIGAYAFSDCKIVISLTLGASTENIGEGAFSGCTALQTLKIPAVTSLQIADKVFSGAEKLTKVHAGDLKTWCNIKFSDGTVNPLSVDKAELHINGVKTTEIDLTGIEQVNAYAFYNYKGMTKLVIGESVKSIGKNAFYGCDGLTSITYKATECADLTEDTYAFVKAGGKDLNLTIGANVNRIPAYLFAGENATNKCALTGVTFEKKTQSTEEGAAGGSLTIGAYAFKNCAGISELAFDWSLKEIEEGAFSGCTLIKKLTISDEIAPEILANNILSDCNAITDLVCSVDMLANISVSKVENLHITEGEISNEAFKSCSGLKTLTIGDNVTRIGKEAFANCGALETVKLNGKDLVIDSFAFYGDKALKTVSFSENVKEIGQYAFYQCEGLKEVVLSDSITTIGEAAFQYCYQLEKVVIGKNVKNMDTNAFHGCIRLENVQFSDKVGWILSKDGKETNISSTILADSMLAAEALREKYSVYSWVKQN